MGEFTSKSVKLAGGFTVAAAIEEVFPLFSPLGEKRWVPGWNPELLHPPGAIWEQGLVFRTREEMGDAVWIVTRLDHAGHEVEYHRVEPGRYVARIRVRCRAVSERVTEASTSYEFIGLSDRGNADIVAMTQDGYAEKMSRWRAWIDELLAAQPRGRL